MLCDLIIPVWNGRDFTRDCIESIVKNTQYPYRIIAIDNGSEDCVKDYLQSLKESGKLNFVLIRNEDNLGYTKAVNQGLRYSNADFVAILNNDTIVTKGWLGEMITVMNLESDIGLVNPASNTLGTSSLGISLEAIESCARKCRVSQDRYIELGTAIGFCMLVKRELIGKIGLWDEDFSPSYFDDTEYAIRAARAGYKSVCAMRAYVYHQEHASFRNKNLEKIFQRSQKIFYEKCGKPKRILYIIDRYSPDLYARIEKEAYNLAKDANWVWIFLKKGLPQLNLKKHGNIRQFSFSPFFFAWKAVGKVLKRQKKKFDQIYIEDKKIFKMLRLLRFIHRSKLVKLV